MRGEELKCFKDPRMKSHLALYLIALAVFMIKLISKAFLLGVLLFNSHWAQAEQEPKAKIGHELDRLQQDLMQLQNRLREGEDLGQCQTCASVVRSIEQRAANLAWFFALAKPSVIEKDMIPLLTSLQEGLQNPESQPFIYQQIGDVMAHLAYAATSLQDIRWDSVWWERVEASFPIWMQAQQSNMSLSFKRRAQKAFDEAMKKRDKRNRLGK